MRQLRLTILTKSPASLGIKPTAEFPRIDAVVIDWPITPNTATIVASAAGDASLYTTSTFGVIGGVGHEPVRQAAKQAVKLADSFFNDAAPTTDFSYPDAQHVRFYFVTYDGVRSIEAPVDSVFSGKDKLSPLFGAAQNVLTQLRLVSQNK